MHEKSQDQTSLTQHTNVLALQVVLQEGQGQDHNNKNVKLHPACTKPVFNMTAVFEQVV
jgi:hypothetical protein